MMYKVRTYVHGKLETHMTDGTAFRILGLSLIAFNDGEHDVLVIPLNHLVSMEAVLDTAPLES